MSIPSTTNKANKLIVVMIDGVSANHFLKHKDSLPTLSKLANAGTWVQRLHPVQPATSLPGRTSMMTGVDATQHGVWGNTIWDGEQFRYATPDDIRVPTLPQIAMQQERDVAVLGFGMLPPEHAHVYHHPWWIAGMIQRARDNEPLPAHAAWLRTTNHKDGTGRLAALAERGYPHSVLNPFDASDNPQLTYFVAEAVGDSTMMQWTAGLATSEQTPDLIVTEILMPDSVQHVAGYGSLQANWSVLFADSLVGQLVNILESAGQEDYTLAIMSDHGHGAVTQAVYPHAIIPDATYACECGWLYVHYNTQAELDTISQKLAEHDVTIAEAPQLPADMQGNIAAFLAPDGYAFENLKVDTPVAAPKTLSTHGFRPDTDTDDRFCLFYGKDIPQQVIESAEAVQIAPTLAHIIGVEDAQFKAASIL